MFNLNFLGLSKKFPLLLPKSLLHSFTSAGDFADFIDNFDEALTASLVEAAKYAGIHPILQLITSLLTYILASFGRKADRGEVPITFLKEMNCKGIDLGTKIDDFTRVVMQSSSEDNFIVFSS